MDDLFDTSTDAKSDFDASVVKARVWSRRSTLPERERLEHEKLPFENTLRLLKKNGGSQSEFDCSLHTYRIDEAPPYIALSYTWAAPTRELDSIDKHEFYIICNGKKRPMTPNLFTFLALVGPDTTISYLWVDQVCINQEDPIEKANQVARMGTIYARAARVIVWLGMPNRAADITYNIMESFLPAYMKAVSTGKVKLRPVPYGDKEFWDQLGLDPWTDEEVAALVHFLERRWFQRAWTVQEFALAAETVVFCGGLQFGWSRLADLSRLLQEFGWSAHLYWLYVQSQKSVLKEAGPDALIVPLLPIASRPMCFYALQQYCDDQYSRGMLDKASLELQILETRFYKLLHDLLIFFRTSRATQAVDKIYAPLALATQLLLKETDRTHFLLPDYTLNIHETFIRASTLIPQGMRSLSILSHVEDHSSRTLKELPSWVPDFSLCSIGPMSLAFSGTAFPFDPTFNALSGCLVNPTLIVSGTTLNVKGVLWDTVHDTVGSSSERHFSQRPSTWLSLCSKLDKIYFNGQKRDEVIWRTMICDRDQAGDSPADSRLRTNFHDFAVIKIAASADFGERKEAIQNRRPGSLQWPELDALAADSSGKVLPNFKEIVKFARWVTTHNTTRLADKISRMERLMKSFASMEEIAREHRKLFRTAKNALGYGPMSLQKNDVVAFLVGATVPFILRRVDSGQYRLVGETYVHGFMFGEVLKDKSLKFEEVKLI